MHLYTTDSNNLINNKKAFINFLNSNSWNIFQENWLYWNVRSSQFRELRNERSSDLNLEINNRIYRQHVDAMEERPLAGTFLFVSSGGAKYHVVLETTNEGGVRISWRRTSVRPRGIQISPTWHHPARYTASTKEAVLKELEELHVTRDMSHAACSFLGIDD
jgi:hypothetical protein